MQNRNRTLNCYIKSLQEDATDPDINQTIHNNQKQTKLYNLKSIEDTVLNSTARKSRPWCSTILLSREQLMNFYF